MTSRCCNIPVTVNGFVEEIRNLGGIAFIKLLRNGEHVQVTIRKDEAEPSLLDALGRLTRQSHISVTGEMVENKKARLGRELLPTEMRINSIAESPLPLDPSYKTPAELKTRLDWRPLDLRAPASHAVFDIQAKMIEIISGLLTSNGFQQIFTPCLMSANTEGGADVFHAKRKDQEATLRQDSQLHRILALLGGAERIFEIGPAWRADNSHTTMHLTEHRICAIELANADDTAIINMQQDLFKKLFERLSVECRTELGMLGISLQSPKLPFPVISFPEIYDTLARLGKHIEYGQDYDTEARKLLANHFKNRYDSDFFFITGLPFASKSFYAVRRDDDRDWTRGVDLVYNGIGISSGGQREHRHAVLLRQIQEKRLNEEWLRWFTEYFRYGAPQIAGFSIGLERLTMQTLGLKNIREAVLFPRTTDRMEP